MGATSSPRARAGQSDAELALRAPVLEVFASFQGEGAFVGEPQVFVRLAGCPLRCRWCDTPGSWRVSAEPHARVAASGGVRREPGWASPFQVATWIAAAEPGAARTISVTGGEPLLWPGFVRALRTLTGARRIHLETAGAHPRALEEVLDAVDHVSLDLKLPEDLDAPVPVAEAHGAEPAPADASDWDAVRARVLALVAGRDACGKLILAGGRAPAAFAPILDDVARRAPELALFVQPVTPMNGVPAPSPDELLELCELARERDLRVRVVPQVHRFLGVP
jgi:7-carboxy-7-deazaguanine synthase